MTSDDPIATTRTTAEPQTEEEIRTLLRRLLRLIAIEVAKELRSRERPTQLDGRPPMDLAAEALRRDTNPPAGS
jgi:hypothetical protein